MSKLVNLGEILSSIFSLAGKKVAKMREGQPEAQRPQLGRRKFDASVQPDNRSTTDEYKQTTQE